MPSQLVLDQIVILILVFSMIGIVTYSMFLTKNIDSLKGDLAQSMLDRSVLLEELAKEMDKNANKIHNDSFIKFLSDSRDSAFTYIEDVQEAISEFAAVADKTSFARSVNKELIKQYKEAYDKLLNLLPTNADVSGK